MRKLLIFFFLLFLFPNSALGFAKETFLTVSHPVRGPEDWQISGQDPLDLPRFQFNEATRSGTPVTWMLRYDTVADASMSAFFKKVIEIKPDHDLGAFFEITPELVKLVDVAYPPGFSAFNANRIFLSGYTQEKRIKIIDAFMSAFKDRYGFYPRSVGAWHIDAFSLKYLREKYSVLTALICDEQYGTDGYRLWGGYLGSPYIPSESNVLIPATNKDDRIDIVIVRWAQRDLFNFYGAGGESAYSVQVNDYLGKFQDTAYFAKLLDVYSQKNFNEFTHINLGLENDYSLKLYRQEIINSDLEIKSRIAANTLKPVTLATLGNFVLNFYPQRAPIYHYQTPDPTEKNPGLAIWYQSPSYRLGITTASEAATIIDLRVYNQEIYEDHYVTQNTGDRLYLEVPPAIDTVKYPLTGVPISFNFETADVENTFSSVKYTDGNKLIEFNPTSIVFTNLDPFPVPEGIKVSKVNSTVTWKASPVTPFSPQLKSLLFLLAVFIPLIIVSLPFNKSLALGFFFALITTATVIRSGGLFPFGLGIWGPNGHDAVFHISLIKSFSENPLDFSHPQISGEQIGNYHLLFDYLGGLISRISGIEPMTFYFVLFPIVAAIAVVLLLGKLLTLWKYSPLQRSLSFLFVFLTGSLGFIPSLIKGGGLFTGESAFWANQSASWLLNPPFALSLILLLLFLILLENKNKKYFIPLVVIGGLLAQTKVYSFALLVGALVLSGQWILGISVGVLGVVFLLPFTKIGSSPFTLKPLWFTESLFASFDRVWWPKFSQAWQTYQSQGNFPKLIAVNLFALMVFLLGNLGVRVIGLKRIQKFKSLTLSEKVSLWIILLGILAPLIIIQKVNPWNTIQFTYYSLFFLGIFTAKEVAVIIERTKSLFLKLLFLTAVLFLTLPTSIGTLKDYFTRKSSSRVSYTELSALDFLRKQPSGMVLTSVFSDKWVNRTPEPRSLYGYVSTAYISALSGQKEFLSDTINLDITGYNYDNRVRDILRLQNTQDSQWARDFLKENNITYVYQIPFMRFKLNPDQLCLTKIFDSGEINIYKFNCHGQD